MNPLTAYDLRHNITRPLLLANYYNYIILLILLLACVDPIVVKAAELCHVTDHVDFVIILLHLCIYLLDVKDSYCFLVYCLLTLSPP